MFGFDRLFGPKTDFRQLLQDGALILDVRTPREYASGHIKGSRNIPVEQVGRHINDLRKMRRPIITCCLSGSRSGMAAGLLKAAGIEAHNGGPWHSLQKHAL